VLGVWVGTTAEQFFRDGHNRFLEADCPPASAKGQNQLVITEAVAMAVSTNQRKYKKNSPPEEKKTKKNQPISMKSVSN
jgi:hypothetical protein